MMEEHHNQGEQVTQHLLARENQCIEEVRGQLNSAVDGEEKPGGYVSSITGVLIFSSFVAVCGSLNYGLAVGYSSPVESEIIDDLGFSIAEYSLFGSFITIGGALGATACGKMSDYLGRRGTFGVTDVLSIAGWLVIVASQSILPLYLGRLLLGFSLGLSAYVVPIYVAEITPKDLRGGLLRPTPQLGLSPTLSHINRPNYPKTTQLNLHLRSRLVSSLLRGKYKIL